VVELHDEGDLVGVLARDAAEHAERRGDAVAAALDGQPDDVLRVEEIRVGREGGAGGMLDALVHRQQRKVAAAGQAAVVEQRGEVAQHRRLAVGLGDDAVDEIRTGQMQPGLRDAAAFVLEELVGFVAEEFDDVGHDGLLALGSDQSYHRRLGRQVALQEFAELMRPFGAHEDKAVVVPAGQFQPLFRTAGRGLIQSAAVGRRGRSRPAGCAPPAAGSAAPSPRERVVGVAGEQACRQKGIQVGGEVRRRGEGRVQHQRRRLVAGGEVRGDGAAERFAEYHDAPGRNAPAFGQVRQAASASAWVPASEGLPVDWP
jgi:hypothetical protein